MPSSRYWSRPCEWDGVTSPYRPNVPVVLSWISAADPGRPRVVVPDVEGFYWNLVPGRKYIETQLAPVVLVDCTVALPRTREAGTQVDWHDLPALPVTHHARYLPSMRLPEMATSLEKLSRARPKRGRSS